MQKSSKSKGRDGGMLNTPAEVRYVSETNDMVRRTRRITRPAHTSWPPTENRIALEGPESSPKTVTNVRKLQQMGFKSLPSVTMQDCLEAMWDD